MKQFSAIECPRIVSENPVSMAQNPAKNDQNTARATTSDSLPVGFLPMLWDSLAIGATLIIYHIGINGKP